MEVDSHTVKRPRLDNYTNENLAHFAVIKKMESPTSLAPLPSLINLLQEHEWTKVVERVQLNPNEACEYTLDQANPNPSPLALACRLGAPCSVVKAILKVAPYQLWHVLDSRGTPLHEAIVCEQVGVEVIDVLLEADEMLAKNALANKNDSNMRATLLQDVDGFTPLHLLIRRRFQTHILLDSDSEDSKADSTTFTSDLMQILERLVSSCPEAVIVPDRGEYEEPPIIYAIKANIYSPSLGSEDETLARIERQIYEMVDIMLKYNPRASSCVFTGYRGNYTALHSAVFHGRNVNTIELLLKAEEQYHTQLRQQLQQQQLIKKLQPQDQSTPIQLPPYAALLANTQGELPLHFCAMRGERPRTVELLARAAPEAVGTRDVAGLTPFHWLWIRFVSTLLAVEDDSSNNNSNNNNSHNATITLGSKQVSPFETNSYNCFTALEQCDFDTDLQLFMRMDPPVDFFNMRHIPHEVLGDDISLVRARRSVEVLQHIRARYQANSESDDFAFCTWTRREVIISSFWNKVVSLLSAVQVAYSSQPTASSSSPEGVSHLVHTAFASHCCPPAVAFIAASLFSNEMSQPDHCGRLPIHHAAKRPWNFFDWPRDDSFNESIAARLLRKESLLALKTALSSSSPETLGFCDNMNRLPLHYTIEVFIKACYTNGAVPLTVTAPCLNLFPFEDMLSVLANMLARFPESLHRRDGITKLYPFLQAAAAASELASPPPPNNSTLRRCISEFPSLSALELDRTQQLQIPIPGEEMPLSITYLLLRNSPTLLQQLLGDEVQY